MSLLAIPEAARSCQRKKFDKAKQSVYLTDKQLFRLVALTTVSYKGFT